MQRPREQELLLLGRQLKVNRSILATETMYRAVFGSLRSRVNTHAQTKVKVENGYSFAYRPVLLPTLLLA